MYTIKSSDQTAPNTPQEFILVSLFSGVKVTGGHFTLEAFTTHTVNDPTPTQSADSPAGLAHVFAVAVRHEVVEFVEGERRVQQELLLALPHVGREVRRALLRVAEACRNNTGTLIIHIHQKILRILKQKFRLPRSV